MKKKIFFLLFFCPFLMFGQRVSLPYFQNFENCLNNSEWQTGITGITSISKCGTISLPSGITYGMTISKNYYISAEGLGYATLKLDLSNSINTFLDFKWKWTNYVKNYSSCWNDNYMNSISGVYISGDDGATFTKIYTFTGGQTNPSGEFISVKLDLSLLAAQNGIQMNNKIVLKVQCYCLYNQSGSCWRDFGIDDISIYNDCVPNFTFSNTNSLHNNPRSNGYYEASDYISAGPNVQVQPGTKVTFNAGNSVKLKTGFRAYLNSSFRAYLEGCSNLKSTQPVEADELAEPSQNPAGFNLYPNPSPGIITIEYLKANGNRYVIYNATGKIVIQGQLTGSVTALDMTRYPKGLYIIKINELGNTEGERFILK